MSRRMQVEYRITSKAHASYALALSEGNPFPTRLQDLIADLSALHILGSRSLA